MKSTLITNVSLPDRSQQQQVLIENGRIAQISSYIASQPHIVCNFDAKGGCLLPSLNDHHIHLLSLAASRNSLDCTRMRITTKQALIDTLRVSSSPQSQWLRITGYHTGIAGDIDRFQLDQWIRNRPVRIQHRGGRLWILNSAAIANLLSDPSTPAPCGLEYGNKGFTGRLYEGDSWLRGQIGASFPTVGTVSLELARMGITGFTDATPSNGTQEWQYFNLSQQSGELLQTVRMMGSLELNDSVNTPQLQLGEYKVHLLESNMPVFDELCEDLQLAHSKNRNIAFHCVTRLELVFALAALRAVGVKQGDRIEHASITPPELLEQLQSMGLGVVTQPQFIRERGDDYLRNVDEDDLPWLYRCHAFLKPGISLAAGSDAPFGDMNPWAAMQDAVMRTTEAGQIIGSEEKLTPEQALKLYLGTLEMPASGNWSLIEGAYADLCLLDRTWLEARENLANVQVQATWHRGTLIYHDSD